MLRRLLDDNDVVDELPASPQRHRRRIIMRCMSGAVVGTVDPNSSSKNTKHRIAKRCGLRHTDFRWIESPSCCSSEDLITVVVCPRPRLILEHQGLATALELWVPGINRPSLKVERALPGGTRLTHVDEVEKTRLGETDEPDEAFSRAFALLLRDKKSQYGRCWRQARFSSVKMTAVAIRRTGFIKVKLEFWNTAKLWKGAIVGHHPVQHADATKARRRRMTKAHSMTIRLVSPTLHTVSIIRMASSWSPSALEGLVRAGKTEGTLSFDGSPGSRASLSVVTPWPSGAEWTMIQE